MGGWWWWWCWIGRKRNRVPTAIVDDAFGVVIDMGTPVTVPFERLDDCFVVTTMTLDGGELLDTDGERLR